MKVVIMSMPDLTRHLIHESVIHLPCLGIASLGANIDEGHEVYIIDLLRKRGKIKKYVTRTLKKIQPDVVGLSSMAMQYDTCKKIMKLVKTVLPDAKIALGGYHATLMYEDIIKSPESELIDYIVYGEGEESFRRLINALEGKDSLRNIPSLIYKENSIFSINKQGGLLDLAAIKRPIRDKRRLTWGYHMLSAKIEVMETSRGCTRACNFCSMRHMYGRTYRTYSIDRVLEDIDYIYYKEKN